MTLTRDMLAKLTTPKPHRKGETEERIFAKNRKLEMTTKLIAAAEKSKALGSVRG